VSALSGVAVADNERFGLSPAGWLAGGQLGYNWQVHNLVLGVEADWQWTNQKDSACVLDCILQFSLNETQKLDSFGTARVRAGYAADHFGSSFAFTGLAAVAATGLAMIWFVMPETRRSPG